MKLAFRLLVLLAVLALGVWGWRTLRERLSPPLPPAAAADTVQTGMRATTLFFADAGGDTLVTEARELPEKSDLHARVAQLVDALVRGPQHRGVAVLPAGTSVLHVYLDDQGRLTLDLSPSFQQGFHGGTQAEDLVLGSLVRTLGANLPEVKRVRIVCGGQPIGSLAGHLPLDQPLDPHEAD
ncbi:MAG TPA: GerMN domain-containing protein [Candidatus Acidoferrales bacterium]|nr:GerMN domain-containing protein [Candidatus Acidoferrales bacterium]